MFRSTVKAIKPSKKKKEKKKKKKKSLSRIPGFDGCSFFFLLFFFSCYRSLDSAISAQLFSFFFSFLMRQVW